MTNISRKSALHKLAERGIHSAMDYAIEMQKASFHGDIQTLRLLIIAGANINGTKEGGTRPLACAILGGRDHCVEFLLKAPAINPNLADTEGNTPLITAILAEQTECLKRLLASPKVDVNQAASPNGATPLFHALLTSDITILKLLLAHPSIDINKTDNEGYTILCLALGKEQGNPKIIQELLSVSDIDVFKHPKDSLSPLETAVAYNHQASLGLLLKHINSKLSVKQCQSHCRELISFAKSHCRRKCEQIISDFLTNQKQEASIKNTCIPHSASANQEETLMQELNQLIGLKAVKQEVSELIHMQAMIQRRRARGLKTGTMSNHLVFSGNPGTGKTTVARLLAKIYHRIGLLETDKVTEVDRSGLVAQYIGQTAIKTMNVIKEAMGGILFIDEAYTLTRGAKKDSNDFGQEAVDTILKAMEDYRDKFIVIVAGYPDLMQEFIDSNPGLESRFNTYIHFEDYTPDELLQIFISICHSEGYTLSPNAEGALKQALHNIYHKRDKNFANGRDVRNLFEKAIRKQASRLYHIVSPTDAQLGELTLSDLTLS